MKSLMSTRWSRSNTRNSKGYSTTYPKPVELVNAALGFLARNPVDLKVDPATIVLAGDSAGAHIACQVALITADPAYASTLGISAVFGGDKRFEAHHVEL
jgi:acetyl esterase/lipase